MQQTACMLIVFFLFIGSTSAATYTPEQTAAVTAAYPWEDTTGGSGITLNDDQCTGQLSLGFNFPFGGTANSNVKVCSNGVLWFGNGNFTSSNNVALPTGNSGAMFPFWSNLNPQGVTVSAAQGITYRASGSGSNRRFTVTFLRIPHYCSGSGGGCTNNKVGVYTFQVTLFEDGRFVYRYGNTSQAAALVNQSSDTDAGSSATIGYEVSNADYFQYSYNVASAHNGDVILWRPVAQKKVTGADSICGAPTQVSLTLGTTVNKASAETAANYAVVTPSGTTAAVSSAVLASDNQTVTLTLAAASANQIYIVSANGVQTTAGQFVYDAFSYTTGSAGATGVIGDYFKHDQVGSAVDDINPYFSVINGRTQVVRQDAAINFANDSTGFFPSGSNVHDYSTRWLGYIVPTSTAKYCVSAQGDDGVRVYLDGSRILDGWVLQSPRWYTTATPLSLNAGQYYRLQMEYYERGGQAYSKLQWAQTTGNTCSGNPPGGSATIPSTNLYSCKVQPGPSAFRISHSGTGINCTPSAVTITAVDATGNIVTNFTGTIALGTSTGHGAWSTTSGGAAITNYTFTAANNGSVTLWLADTYPESVNINIASGSIVEDPAYDLSLVFKPTGLRFTPNFISQIAARPFTGGPYQVEVVGTDPSNNQCTTLVTNTTQAVNFATECEEPTSCVNTSQASINGTAISGNNNGAVTNYTSINLNFNNNGFAPLSFNYPDAGQIKFYANAVVAIAGTNGATTANVTGATNPVVVRPFGFCIAPSSSINANPNATAANDTVFTTAGSDFATTLKAAAWGAADDNNNDGLPDSGANLCDNAVTPNFGRHTTPPTVTVSSTLQLPSSGNSGLLTGNTTINAPFNNPNGQYQATLNWSEVGIITLKAETKNYLNSGADIVTSRANVGRFIPHHFALVSGSILTNRSDLASCLPPSSFSYLGEPLKLAFSLEARNAGDQKTNYYADYLAKLSSVSQLNAAAIATGAPRTALTPTLSGTIAWASGTGAIDVDATIPRAHPMPLIGPYAAVAFGVAPVDSDNVATTGFDLDTSAPADGSNDHVQIGATTNLYYGRLRLNSASGPSDIDLPIPIAAEYWNGSQFVTNTADNCTAINGALATLSNSLGATTPTGTATLNKGQSQTALILTAPGAGIFGNVTATLDLTNPGNNYPYLQFDWNGDGAFDITTSATASFGTYRGSDRVIYWRE